MITVYGDVVRLSDSPTFDFSVDAFETMVYHNLAICTARQVAYARLRSANDGWADWEDSDFEDIPELVDPFEAAGDQGTTAILGRVGEHCHAPAGGGAQRAGVREPETSQKVCYSSLIHHGASLARDPDASWRISPESTVIPAGMSGEMGQARQWSAVKVRPSGGQKQGKHVWQKRPQDTPLEPGPKIKLFEAKIWGFPTPQMGAKPVATQKPGQWNHVAIVQ
ncbi:hypothetical protein GGX14DRAFT_660741 [Mycena pura]|uniref:Uncharacterized protein n=1 Tax=Mycena pura TaxID=153505 RepID=A0AAD6V5D8_9AGAR|nr:hypothetical protein GGX14DRAFT_660741 [Mycena pura]